MELGELLNKLDEVLKELESARKKKNNREEKKKLEREFENLSKESSEEIKKALPEIIKDDYRSLVIAAEILGKCLKEESLSTSQIRNIFSEIKEMEMRGFKENDTEKRLLLLKPKLAYAGRPGAKKGTRVLRDILTSAIDDVLEEGITKDKFENFCKFFEAILAYHRAAGGN